MNNIFKFRSFENLMFKLNNEFPIYDEKDNVIGFTNKNDIIIITYDYWKNWKLKQINYELNIIETVLLSGNNRGYDLLIISYNDLIKATFLNQILIENYDEIYANNIKLKLK